MLCRRKRVEARRDIGAVIAGAGASHDSAEKEDDE